MDETQDRAERHQLCLSATNLIVNESRLVPLKRRWLTERG